MVEVEQYSQTCSASWNPMELGSSNECHATDPQDPLCNHSETASCQGIPNSSSQGRNKLPPEQCPKEILP